MNPTLNSILVDNVLQFYTVKLWFPPDVNASLKEVGLKFIVVI